VWCRKARERFEVWSEVYPEVGSMDPWVNTFHDIWEDELVVVMFIWSFANIEGS